jgi:phytanoyl-CoA dioxygenase PhyH
MIWEFDSNSISVNDIRKAFRVLGFVVIRNVLDRQEVTLVRSALDRAFGSAHLQDLPTLVSTEMIKHEPIWRTLFKERVVNSLRAVLGPELCYQHDLDVQRNSFGLIGSKLYTGWHMDAGSETGNEYLRAADYRFAKCGIFLQDFDNGWGGGIRVKPKSHRGLFEPNRFKRRVFFCRRALNRIALMMRMDVDTFEVPTRAGDLCFFDSRLLHSSVPPSQENIKKIGYDQKPEIRVFWPDIPKEYTKYVVYWDACNAAMVDDFLRNSMRRSESEPEGFSESSLRPAAFTRVLSVKYPDDFPEEFVAAASECRIGVASLSLKEAAFYKQKLQTMRLLYP